MNAPQKCLLLALLALAASCDDNTYSASSGELGLSATYIDFGAVPLGVRVERQIALQNISVSGTQFEVSAATLSHGDFEIECSPSPTFALRPGQRAVCTLTFEPSAQLARNATLTFETTATLGQNTVTLVSQAAPPNIVATPASLALRAHVDLSAQKTVALRNNGTGPLRISGYEVTGQADTFSATHDESIHGPISPENPLVLMPGDDALEIDLHYSPPAPGSDSAALRVNSNDPDTPLLEVPLIGRSDLPCAQLDAVEVDFGVVQLGDTVQRTLTATNCGTETLIIDRLEPGDNPAFTIDAQDPLSEPIRVDSGESATFDVFYTASVLSPERGHMVVHSNDPLRPSQRIELFGEGDTNLCPTARATATIRGSLEPPATELTARPLDFLILDGLASEDPDGPLSTYLWEIIERPDGSVAEITTVDNEPADPARRQLFLDLGGRFTIRLTVIDENGCASEPVDITVIAVPAETILIQVTWNNPADPDQTDLSGSDVDTHFVKMGPGAWFQSPYDNYFGNREPFWNPEHPSLDIDDTNGAGPEIISMDDPIECQWYAVGVHYWRQQFGTAFVTAQIFINGALAFELGNQPLQESSDFLDVARIHWPTATIVPVGTVTTRSAIDRVPPEITQGMIDTGLCGVPDP